jgi:hypothetical protein
MNTKLQFLTARERYSVRLPDDVEPTPDMAGVIVLDGSAREVIYQPATRMRDPKTLPEIYSHQFDVTAKGVTVSVYERKETPKYLAAFWWLRDGYLNTFMDEPTDCGDGSKTARTGIETVISSLDVDQFLLSLPQLVLRAPLQRGNWRDPAERDMTSFYPRAGTWPVVRAYKEPPWAREGSQRRHLGDFTEASVTTTFQLTVSCEGPTANTAELENTAAEVAASLVPGS